MSKEFTLELDVDPTAPPSDPAVSLPSKDELEEQGKKTNLNARQLRLASFIEQKFWEHGFIPTEEVIEAELGETRDYVKRCYKGVTFRRVLAARGVDFNPEASKGVLTPIQVALANMLLDSNDKTSVREKLKLIGISSQQYHAWLRQPAFADYLRKRAEAQFANSDFKAYRALTEAVEKRDVNAIKLFFEMRGIYNPKVTVDVNVHVLVAKIVEVVSKHVSDVDVLEAIATDIETLELPKATD